ncbi:MAG: hypothetical protein ABI670_21120 [Chloroflexota bacterium]
MSQPNRRGSRIAGALRDDASLGINDELDMWPGISERLSTQQATADSASKRPSAGTVAGQDAWTKSAPRIGRAEDRRGNRSLSLSRGIPAMGLTVAMVLVMLMGSLLPRQQEQVAPLNRDIDACSLITQQEADQLAGKHMEQYQWKPVRPNTYACAYFTEGESINLMVSDFHSERELREYMQNVMSGPAVPSDSTANMDFVGDETFTRSRKPSAENINFWDVIMNRQNRYFIVTWMTDKPDPSASLKALADKVAERLPSR